MIKDFFWQYFAQTGSIDAYLLYTEDEDALVFPDESIDYKIGSTVDEHTHMK
ncbi:YqzL family protein [Aneurinibacillus sp. REN35]|uniref:YqzL family protein n=1 Tax=Aneurinibacillus sp. REN35 TaxID=3237286 RepID=UPI003529484A